MKLPRKNPSINPEAVMDVVSQMQGMNGTQQSSIFKSEKIQPIKFLEELQEKMFTEPQMVVYFYNTLNTAEDNKDSDEFSEIADLHASEDIKFYSLNTQQVVEVSSFKFNKFG